MSGEVDQVTLLDASPALPREEVHAAIGGNLHLKYQDERRHRTVVYGKGTVTADGDLVVEMGAVVVAQCCEGDCCFLRETGSWLCPRTF